MWGMSIGPDFVTAIVDGMDALSLLRGGLVGLIWLTVGLLAWMAAYDLLSQGPTFTDSEYSPSERLTVREEKRPQARIFGSQAEGEPRREAFTSSPLH